MKNVLLLLTALVLSFSSYTAQIDIYAPAPVATGTVNSYMPTGYQTSDYYRNCYLFKGSELPTFTSTLITGLGFSLNLGAMVPVTGTVQLYMQNTTDLTYQKGTSYSNIISPMTPVYTGTMLIPANTNTANTIITLNTPFNYTGNGIYVALSWTAATSFNNINGSARYYSNISSTGQMGAFQLTNGQGVNTLQQTTVRPVYIFKGLNNSSNEAAVTGITAPGFVAEGANIPHQITARIMNNSNVALNNKQVSLNVTGANPFTDTQTIPTIAAGATTTVIFAAYQPTALGLSTINVTLPADDINTNNQMAWGQNVSCHVAGYMPYFGNYGPTIAYNNSGIFSTRFNSLGTTTLTGMDIEFPQGVVGTYVYGSLQNASGQVIATTNTLQPISAVETFTFNTPQVLSANTNYYIGLSQPNQATFVMATYLMDNTYVPGRFYRSQLNGTGLTVETTFGSYPILPLFAGPEISVSPASTVVCSGEPVTLSGSGGSVYTWASASNPIQNPNTAQVSLSPTSTEIYTLTGTSAAGCVGTTTAQVDVELCVGIKKLGSAEALISIYPNPTEGGTTTVYGLSGLARITVFNFLGQVVLQQESTTEKVMIDLKGQASGNYLVQISASNSAIRTFKLINP